MSVISSHKGHRGWSRGPESALTQLHTRRADWRPQRPPEMQRPVRRTLCACPRRFRCEGRHRGEKATDEDSTTLHICSADSNQTRHEPRGHNARYCGKYCDLQGERDGVYVKIRAYKNFLFVPTVCPRFLKAGLRKKRKREKKTRKNEKGTKKKEKYKRRKKKRKKKKKKKRKTSFCPASLACAYVCIIC